MNHQLLEDPGHSHLFVSTVQPGAGHRIKTRGPIGPGEPGVERDGAGSKQGCYTGWAGSPGVPKYFQEQAAFETGFER